MPWNDHSPHCGFSRCEQPWLPIPRAHRPLNVTRQQQDPESLLNDWRSLLNWHTAQPAMRVGKAELVDTIEPWLVLRRRYAEQTLLCIFNLSDAIEEIELKKYTDPRPIQGLGFQVERLSAQRFRVPAWSALILDVSHEHSAIQATAQPDWEEVGVGLG